MKDELGLLNLQETAEFLRLSPTAVQKLRNAGDIPFVKFGSKVYYRKDSLIKYVEGQETFTGENNND